MKVRVYFNLRKKMISVQAKVNGSWKVVNHINELYLKDSVFKVSEAGRQRVIKNRRKNVHAFIYGEIVESLPNPMTLTFNSVYYNPYKVSKFQIKNQDIERADYVYINNRSVFAGNY